MSDRSDLEFVNDIKEAINRIKAYTSLRFLPKKT